jgi:iron complex transport system ATP-binding protein
MRTETVTQTNTLAEPTDAAREVDDRVLVLDGVTFRRAGRVILDDIDLTARAGEHWAVLGPNGAGKSTMLSLCGANNHPTSGTVHVLGHRLGRIDVQTLRTLIGHVNPRHPIDTSLSVEEVVMTGFTGTIDLPRRWSPDVEETARVRDAIALVGLADRDGLRWPSMSQGERGRALIARALVGRPQLMLLDEPTTGLDLAAREQLLTAIDAVATGTPRAATVLVTHHLEELPRTTSHAALMREGRLIAAGPVDEVLTSAQVSDAFRHPIEVNRVGGRWSASGAAAS